MAPISRGPNSERANLAPVKNNRITKQNPSNAVVIKLAAAAVVLVVLGVAVKYFVPGSKHAKVQAAPIAPQVTPADLQVNDLQMSWSPFKAGVLFVDGAATNAGSSPITGATAEVVFHDLQGKVIASVQMPIGGIPHGGAGLIKNEFVDNPIQPQEVRFFRVRLEQTPPDWNHELPELTILEVKAQ